MLKDDIETLEREGFIHKRKLVSSLDCEKIISYLSTRPAALNIPFSDVAWGFGNMIADSELSSVHDNQYINTICKEVLGENFEFNHLMVNNKAPFIGPGIEWHQEIAN